MLWFGTAFCGVAYCCGREGWVPIRGAAVQPCDVVRCESMRHAVMLNVTRCTDRRVQVCACRASPTRPSAPLKITPLTVLAGKPVRPSSHLPLHTSVPPAAFCPLFLFFASFFLRFHLRCFRKLLQELRLNGECSESNKFMVQALVLDEADNHNTAVAVVSFRIAWFGFFGLGWFGLV